MEVDSITIINEILPKYGKVWLDLGCGDAEHTSLDRLKINRKFDHIIAVEGHLPAIQSRKQEKGIEYVCEDIKTYRPKENLDLVTAIHVLEHVPLEEAKILLSYYKKKAKLILVETPNEFEPGKQEVKKSGNPYQAHLCLIDKKFMEELGFTLYTSYKKNKLYSNSIYLWKANEK